MNDESPSARAVPIPEGRLNRLARIGGFATQVAGNVAMQGAIQFARGQRPDLRSLVLTPSNIQRLTNELAQMRGAAMKLGQLLSMDAGDILPPELTDILARLRSDAHFMPPKQLKQVLINNWGKDWLRNFKQFDVRPIAAASIGQVHRATLRDGRTLAIKVQYPGIARSIDSDVANVGALLRASRILPSHFDIAPYLEEAKRQLHEETDYAREGQYMASFRARLADQPQFQVPEFYPDWSTPNVLCMSFAQGRPIESLEHASQDTRNAAASHLFALMLRELFEFGEVQTDPNFANYLFDADTQQLVLLDFGATRITDRTVTGHYRDLFMAGLKNERAALLQAAVHLGVLSTDMADRHRDRIAGMLDLSFAALRESAVYDFADTALSDRMQAEGMALVQDGFLPPPVPMDVLYLQRKLGGLVLLATRLQAKVALRDMVSAHL